MPEVGIVIVTHNSGAEIGPCLDAARGAGAELIVIDNASDDDTRAVVARAGVRLIANERNLGFAAAANQGFAGLESPYILLLNPDAIIRTSIAALRDACAAEGVAAASGMLTGEDGKPQIGFMVRRIPSARFLCFEALLLNRLWPRNPVNWHFRCLGLDYAKSMPVEQPAGAFLMIRRSAWESLGGFDETFYPVWFEDVDFCKRIHDGGYRIQYVPSVVAKHTGGHAIRKILLENRQLYWYGSVLKYSAKHFSAGQEKLVCLAVMIGSLLRMILGISSRRSFKPIAVYGKVVRLACRQLFARRQRGAEVLSVPWV